MGAAETRRALEAAAAAFPGWRARTAADRARILRRWADLMLEHLDDLALLLTLEQGKPLAEFEAEIRYAASFLEWFGEEGKRVYGDTIPSPCPTGESLPDSTAGTGSKPVTAQRSPGARLPGGELELRVGLLDHDRVVRGAHDCGAVLVGELGEQLADCPRVRLVEPGRRLVGEQQHGIGRQGASDRDPLPLARREAVGAMVEPSLRGRPRPARRRDRPRDPARAVPVPRSRARSGAARARAPG